MNTFQFHPDAADPAGNAEMEIRLWDYIDGRSDPKETSFIEQLIASQQEWKRKYEELLEVHQLAISHIDLDEPSMRFTQNVMEEIGKFHIAPAAHSYLNKKIIWGIVIFFFTMIFSFGIFGFSQVNWANASDPSNKYSIDFSKLDWSLFFNNTYSNILIMVTIILGLMILDMYLGKKKKQLSEKTGITE